MIFGIIRRKSTHRMALTLAVCLMIPAAVSNASVPHPLLGKKAPMLSGQAALSSGLLNLDKVRQEYVQVKNANATAGQPMQSTKIVKYAVVLNFFATYCVPCVKEIPSFNKIAAKWGDRPVRFLYVNVDTEKSATEVRDFAKAKGIEVDMILPSVRYVVDAYKIDSLPKIMVVDENGNIAHVIAGFQEDLDKQLNAVLTNVTKKKAA